MSGHEFELINRYFTRRAVPRGDVILGIGDDAALLSVPIQEALAVAVDTLVEGVHFPALTSAADIAYKALAVNLSDLAAMGAVPAWATLALTLPYYDEAWLADFSDGFFSLADQYNVALVGGDTTRGPLTITVQLQGWVNAQQALRRSGAQPGDLIYVSGAIGDAGLGLLACLNKLELAEEDRRMLEQRLTRPCARVALGQALLGIASAAIDVSDGLAADLSHILDMSGVGAQLDLSAVPLSASFQRSRPALRNYLQACEENADIFFALRAGDDYELCFCVPEHKQADVEQIAAELGIALSLIGKISKQPGLKVIDEQGRYRAFTGQGYQHF